MIAIRVGTSLHIAENPLCYSHRDVVIPGCTRRFECNFPLTGCVVSIRKMFPISPMPPDSGLSLAEVRVYGNLHEGKDFTLCISLKKHIFKQDVK